MTAADVWVLLQGFGLSVVVTLGAGAAALVLGIVLALLAMLRVRAATLAVMAVVNFFRNVPPLLYLYFIYAGLPRIGVTLEPLACGLLGLALYTSVFVAEAMRGAILSIHGGQLDAGASLGLTHLQSMRHVLLPQAFRIALPPLFNIFVGLAKNTALLATITVPDLMYQAEIIESRTFKTFQVYTAVALLYWAFIIPLSVAGGRLLEARLERGTR